MNDMNESKKINENDLSAVSGGGIPVEGRIPQYSVGQMVRYSYLKINESTGDVTPYFWSGIIVEVMIEPEGILYRIEADENAYGVTGNKYITVDYERIIEAI